MADRITRDQLDALSVGDKVLTAAHSPGLDSTVLKVGIVTKVTATQIVVDEGPYRRGGDTVINRYRREDGRRLGDSSSYGYGGELVDPGGPQTARDLGVQDYRIRTQRIDAAYKTWSKDTRSIEATARLHSLLGDHLDLIRRAAEEAAAS